MELVKVEFDKVNKKSLLSIAALSGVPAVIIAIKIINNLGLGKGEDTALEILAFSSSLYLGMILPALMTYIAVIVTKVENENSGWKQLMLLPIKKTDIYLTKYKVIILTLLLSIVGFVIADTIGTILITGDIRINLELIMFGLIIFITALPMIVLLFIIGRNFVSIIPVVAVGVGMLITTTFIVQSKYWIFAPWTYGMAIVGGEITNKMRALAIIISLILTIGMFITDYTIFKRSDIKEK